MQVWDRRKLTERLTSLVRRNHVTRNIRGPKYRHIHTEDWIGTDRQDIPHMQNAGFCSNAGSGSEVEAITIDVDADPTHSVAIVVTDENPPDCEEGEACFYAPGKSDNNIKINQDGICLTVDTLAFGELELIDVLIEMVGALNPPQPQIVAKLQAMKC